MSDEPTVIDRLDRIGGKIVGRLWGIVMLIAIGLVAVPIAVGSARDGDWLGTGIALGAAALGALFVRYLFSRHRRLSDYE